MSEPVADRSQLSHLRHDLRTPINHIVGYSELLIEETGDAGHTAYTADLEKILGAAKTLLALINENLTDERLTLAGATVDPGVSGRPQAGSRPPVDLAASGGSQSPLLPTDEPAAIPGHVLIVDDNEGNRDMLARQLVRQGHTVVSAEDGRAALEVLRATSVDLVLLDMMMPVLDGYGTLLEIKKDPALRHLPVIMISALDEFSSVVRCIERGAEDFLPKPFNPTLLRARIGAGLEKKRFQIGRAHV